MWGAMNCNAPIYKTDIRFYTEEAKLRFREFVEMYFLDYFKSIDYCILL